MKIIFETGKYYFAHGKNPAGRGYWGFYIGKDKEAFFVNGEHTFGSAKKAAADEARRRAKDFALTFGTVPSVVVVEVAS